MKHKKRVLIVMGVIILLIISLIFVIDKFFITGESMSNQKIEIVQLSNDEINKVGSILMSSEFIKDVPKNNPIALRFFKFENGQRIWQTGFLIGKNELLAEGEPTIYLALHSKYISELNEENLCETIKKANKKGDLGFESKHNKASLFLRYAKMLKHRECFGF